MAAHTYVDPQTKGVLHVHVANATLAEIGNAYQGGLLYSVAWNRGRPQQVVIDGVSYAFAANTLLPLVVNQAFRFERPQDVVVWQFSREFYCIVNHDREVSCVGFLFYGAKGVMFLPLGEDQSFDALLAVFLEEFATHDNAQGEMLRALVKRLIIKITRLARDHYLDPAIQEASFTLIRQYNLLVETHFRTAHQVQDYAAMLNKSSSTLTNLFAVYNNQRPLQIIHQRIAQEAKRLLLYTDQPVKQIAYELGFRELPHFSRFFKKVAGLNPSDFRGQKGALPT